MSVTVCVPGSGGMAVERAVAERLDAFGPEADLEGTWSFLWDSWLIRGSHDESGFWPAFGYEDDPRLIRTGFSGPGSTGSKHHVIVEAHGIPLATTLTGGNRNDVTQLIPLIQAVPPIRGKAGQPLQRPRRIYADRGYDHDVYRDRVRRFEITPIIARRGTEHGSGLGIHRWVVEAAVALMHWFRRLRIRWERRDDIHQAFMTLGCAIICWRRLKTSF